MVLLRARHSSCSTMPPTPCLSKRKKIKDVVGVGPDNKYDSVRLFVEGAANDSFDACHEDGWKLKTLKEKFTIKLKTLKEKSIILNTHGRCWS